MSCVTAGFRLTLKATSETAACVLLWRRQLESARKATRLCRRSVCALRTCEVLRLTVAGRGTEPAQNPTWEPGAATPSFLGESCGSKITSRLLVVVVLCTGFSACKGFGQMMVCGAVSCFECAPQNSAKNSSSNFQHHELPQKFHVFTSCICVLWPI